MIVGDPDGFEIISVYTDSKIVGFERLHDRSVDVYLEANHTVANEMREVRKKLIWLIFSSLYCTERQNHPSQENNRIGIYVFEPLPTHRHGLFREQNFRRVCSAAKTLR